MQVVGVHADNGSACGGGVGGGDVAGDELGTLELHLRRTPIHEERGPAQEWTQVASREAQQDAHTLSGGRHGLDPETVGVEHLTRAAHGLLVRGLPVRRAHDVVARGGRSRGVVDVDVHPADGVQTVFHCL